MPATTQVRLFFTLTFQRNFFLLADVTLTCTHTSTHSSVLSLSSQVSVPTSTQTDI